MSQENVVWICPVCFKSLYRTPMKCIGYPGDEHPETHPLPYVPAAQLDDRDEQLELADQVADAAGIVLPSSDRYTGPEQLLRSTLDAYRQRRNP